MCEGDGNAGPSVLSSAGDVLEMSVVKGICGVCLTGVGCVWGEWIVFGFYQSWRNRGEWDMCFGCGGVGGSGDVAWAKVWIICVDGRSRYMYIVLGGYMRILAAPIVQSCCTLSISAS